MNVIAFSKRTYTFIQVVKFSITVLGKVYVLVQGVLINLLFLKNPSFPLQLRLNQIFICSSWLFTACNVSFDLNKSLAVEYFLKRFLIRIFRVILPKLSYIIALVQKCVSSHVKTYQLGGIILKVLDFLKIHEWHKQIFFW